MSGKEEYVIYGRQVVAVAFANMLVSLLQFARMPILTNFLGASLYGSWALIWSTVALLAPITLMGLQLSVVRFLAAETVKSEIREGYYSVVLFLVTINIALLIAAMFFSRSIAAFFLGDANQSVIIKIAAFMILSEVLSQVAIAFFKIFRKILWYSSLLILKALLEISLMLIFLSLGWSLKGVIYAVLVADGICITVAFVSIISRIGFGLPRFINLWEYLKFGIPLVPGTAILWMLHSGDKYVISYFLNPEAVGIYGAAYVISTALSLFVAPLQAVLFPAVSKAYDDNEIEKTKTYLRYSLKYLMMFSIPLAFGASILAYPILSILTKPEFLSGHTVVPFISFALVIHGITRVCSYVFYLVKKTYIETALLFIAAALNIGLNFLLIPLYGINGAAIATLLSYMVLAAASLLLSSRYLRFDLEIVFLAKCTLCSVAMTIVLWAISPSGPISLVLSIMLGIVIYGALLLLIRAIDKKEIQLIIAIFPYNIRRGGKKRKEDEKKRR